MTQYYPVLLNIEGLACLVVGGGPVAERKVDSLLESGARVTLVSPQATPRLAELAEQRRILWSQRVFRQGDTTGSFLVISASGQEEVNRLVSEECKTNNIPVNVVDDPQKCGFLVPAVLRRGDLVIAVSSGGASPLVARGIRDELADRYGPEYEQYLNYLAEARAEALNCIPDARRRRQVFARLTDGRLLRLVRGGRMNEAKEWVKECLSSP